MIGTKSKGIEKIGFLSLFLTLISGAISLTIHFTPLYRFSIQRYDLVAVSGLSQAKLLENYRLLLQFLNYPWNNELKLPDFPMSAAGLGHFYDVKQLFLFNYFILFVTLVPTLYFLYYLWKKQQLWRLVRPFQWGILAPVIFLFLMLIGFDTFFVTFHQLFFRNDDWLFNPITDPIITVLPAQFFMLCFVLFFLVLEGLFYAMLRIGKKSVK
ncbi:TIGR01906 family membrane protein [Enterococcus lemanii]|uniref:TIGR01906 family membrane protein n=1 Tax=Enterococcus lemanii TaxID=1159752 RepID=A0ABV9MXT6_9ENTE|nr:TIGR01906 family membrane protein [Enterococcus lemanii]MBM7710095.1 integral membrane protein (TIGR01906 family) [Enterococcus lemanii]